MTCLERRCEARSIYAYPSLHGHDIFGIIIHSKYFAVSDWVQSPGQSLITNQRLPYLEDANNIQSVP